MKRKENSTQKKFIIFMGLRERVTTYHAGPQRKHQILPRCQKTEAWWKSKPELLLEFLNKRQVRVNSLLIWIISEGFGLPMWFLVVWYLALG